MSRLQALLTTATMVALVASGGHSDAAPKKPKKPTKDPKPPPAQVEEPVVTPFDKATAASVLSSIDLTKCKTTNAPKGEGHIMVKFTPAGSASEAAVDKGPLVGTPTAKCVAKEFMKAKVPAFSGDPVQVGKSFKFE